MRINPSPSRKSAKFLLDTSALLVALKKEPGYEAVEDIIARSAASSVSLGELASLLARSGMGEKEIDAVVTDLVPEIIPFSEDIAVLAGKLSGAEGGDGLSPADRACIATGMVCGMDIYTTDKTWLKPGGALGVKIILVG